MVRQGAQHRVLEVGDVGEVERAVEADDHHLGRGGQVGVHLDVAQGAVLVAAENGHARRHGPVEVVADGEQGADHDALVQVRRGHQGDQEGGRGDQAVGPARLPDVAEGARGEQADHGQQDDHRQHRLGQVVDVGGEEQQGEGDEHAVEHHGHAGLGAGLEVDGRTGERARGRVGPEKGAADVGQPLADQFLVGVDALPDLAGHGLGHGDGLHEAHQGDDQGGAQQLQDAVETEAGQTEGRQPGGDRADHLAAAHELQPALVDPFDPPATAVGDHLRRRLVQLVEQRRRGALARGPDKIHPPDDAQPVAVLGLRRLDVQVQQVEPVAQVGHGP